MAFTVLSDRPDDWGDDELFPRPGEERWTIETAPGEAPVHTHRLSSVRVSDVTDGRTRVITDLGEVQGALVVTASRVAIAAETRSGPLVGHVRFAWLTSVLGRDRTPFITPATLVLGFRDPRGDGAGSLQVTLPGRAAGSSTALLIATAAACHRAQAVGHGRVPPVDCAEQAPPAARSGRYVRYELPRAD